MEGAQRIVSLISSGTEIVCALNCAHRLVGISHDCDYPREITSLPRVTHSNLDATQDSAAIDQQVAFKTRLRLPLYTISGTLLEELRPDLIITQSQCDVCAVSLSDVERLVAASPSLRTTRIMTLSPLSIEDVLGDVVRIGEELGIPSIAESVRDRLWRRINAVLRATDPLSNTDRPRCLCIEWLDPLMLAANWTPTLFEWAGAEHGLTTPGSHSTRHDWSAVVRYDPQLLIVSPCGFDAARSWEEGQFLKGIPGWNQLSAVKSGRVFVVDGNAYINRSGPRLVDSLEILAHLIHPSRFPQPLGEEFSRAVIPL